MIASMFGNLFNFGGFQPISGLRPFNNPSSLNNLLGQTGISAFGSLNNLLGHPIMAASLTLLKAFLVFYFHK